MNKYKILAAVVATALMSVAGAASAQVAVNGGGASLPADLYKGTPNILPANFNYAVTGSGTGKSTFLTHGTFPGQSTSSHYAGSDSILSAAELSAYAASFKPTYGPLLQFPTTATSVTLPFNKAGAALNISDANLCGIFSGQITDWSGVTGSGRTGAIQVVYRAESSGTSELFTRFLSSVCGAQPNSTLKNGVFSTTSTFANLFVNNTVPVNFTYAETRDANGVIVIDPVTGKPVPLVGSKPLYDKVYEAGTDGRIGYVGPDVIPDLLDDTKVATLRGFHPSEVDVTRTLDTVPAPTAAADLADPSKWVPVFTNPTDGYPIAGYTNLIIAQCYASTQVAAQVRAFMLTHYNLGATGTNDAKVRAHKFIPLNQNWREAIRNNLAVATSLNGLGNATTCAGVSRPQIKP